MLEGSIRESIFNVSSPPDSSSAASPNKEYRYVVAGGSSALPSRSNWDTELYHRVGELIAKMALLPEDHEYYLAPAVARKALDVLGNVRANTTASAPRVINEDGDTVLLTWQQGDLKAYLCVDSEDISAEARIVSVPNIERIDVTTSKGLDIKKLSKLLGANMRAGIFE